MKTYREFYTDGLIVWDETATDEIKNTQEVVHLVEKAALSEAIEALLVVKNNFAKIKGPFKGPLQFTTALTEWKVLSTLKKLGVEV